jgi:hypothetical protein
MALSQAANKLLPPSTTETSAMTPSGKAKSENMLVSARL